MAARATWPKYPPVIWTPYEKQAFEFLFWLYEADARERGYYLFGASVAELGWAALTEILRPAHPLKGCLPRWTKLARHDPGQPLGLKDDKIAYPVSYSGKGAPAGYIPWTYIKDARTGIASKQPLTINLYCSNRSIYKEFKRRKEEIGFPSSRRRILQWVSTLRTEFNIPPLKPTTKKGERRRRVKWEHIEYLEFTSPLEASRASEARTKLRQYTPATRAWEEYASAVDSHQARFTNP